MLATTCPKCKALFRLADEMAGKKVKCQKCHHVFVVAGGDKGAPDETAGVKRVPKAPAPAPPEMDVEEAVTEDDEPVAPRNKKAATRDDDERDEDDDDRSSRRKKTGRKRYEDDDDDDGDSSRRGRRPKRRAAESRSNTTMVLVLALGGGLLACVLCAGGFGFFFIAAEKNIPIAGNFRDKKLAKKGVARQPGGNQKPAAIDVVFGADGTFRHDTQLTANDPLNVEGTRHKLYRVRMEANRTYDIDMMSGRIDSVLILVDENDDEIDSDDDGGDDLNARLTFTPTRTAFYFIEATHFPDGNGRVPVTGPYTLTIRRR